MLTRRPPPAEQQAPLDSGLAVHEPRPTRSRGRQAMPSRPTSPETMPPRPRGRMLRRDTASPLTSYRFRQPLKLRLKMSRCIAYRDEGRAAKQTTEAAISGSAGAVARNQRGRGCSLSEGHRHGGRSSLGSWGGDRKKRDSEESKSAEELHVCFVRMSTLNELLCSRCCELFDWRT